eukprot:15469187-Alexandrium_andersonii.AAC.1
MDGCHAGGIAVWRPLAQGDARDQAQNILLYELESTPGLLQWQSLTGPGQTAMRAELAALAVALHILGVARVACDNQAVVDFAQDVIAGLECVLARRGAGAALITKVKSHTQEQDLERGVVTASWRGGNAM